MFLSSPVAARVPFLLFLLLALLVVRPAIAADNTANLLLHARWDDLVHKHVTAEGRVDYQGFLDDADQLLDYLLMLRKTAPNQQTWTAEEIEAYWINVYNAATVYLVLQYYPVQSITDIRVKGLGGKSQSPWEAPSVNVGGEQYSLNQIERKILLARFHDARIHFALVQGAVSSPVLLNEAYDGSRLNQQLDQQARRFLNNSLCNNLTPTEPRLSSLFQFYANDFGDQAQLIAFLNRYARVQLSSTAQVNFLPFDWALNDRRPYVETQARRP